MAIDTAQKRYSAMNIMCPWRHVAVLPSGTVGAAARQTIRWLYAGILATTGVVIGIVGDLNTRLRVYLCAYYELDDSTDLTAMVVRYLRDDATGDSTQRFQQLITDATEAMQ